MAKTMKPPADDGGPTQRKPAVVIESAPPVRLDSLNLQDILTIIERHGYQATLNVDGYHPRSINELRGRRNRIRDAVIITKPMGVILKLGRSEVTLIRFGTAKEARACAADIMSLLRAQRRRVAGIIDRGFKLWLLLIAPGCVAPLIVGQFGGDADHTSAALTLFANTAVILSYIGLSFSGAYYWVNTQAKAIIFACSLQESTFWQRNRDPLLVGICLIVATGLITLVSGI